MLISRSSPFAVNVYSWRCDRAEARCVVVMLSLWKRRGRLWKACMHDELGHRQGLNHLSILVIAGGNLLSDSLGCTLTDGGATMVMVRAGAKIPYWWHTEHPVRRTTEKRRQTAAYGVAVSLRFVD